eukprot:8219863-Ditylum_brightwellii.AAC.1
MESFLDGNNEMSFFDCFDEEDNVDMMKYMMCFPRGWWYSAFNDSSNDVNFLATMEVNLSIGIGSANEKGSTS